MVRSNDKSTRLAVNVKNTVFKPHVARAIDKVNATLNNRIVEELSVVCAVALIRILVRTSVYVIESRTVGRYIHTQSLRTFHAFYCPVLVVKSYSLHEEVGCPVLNFQCCCSINMIPYARWVAASSCQAVGCYGYFIRRLTYDVYVRFVYIYQTAVVILVLSTRNLCSRSFRACCRCSVTITIA